MPAALDVLPLFVRAGAVLPTTDTTDFSQRTDEPSRALRLYPAPAAFGPHARAMSAWIEDDGHSLGWQSGALAKVTGALETSHDRLRLSLARAGSYPLPCPRLRLVLPADESRALAWDAPGFRTPIGQ